jgi:hypothetical protein
MTWRAISGGPNLSAQGGGDDVVLSLPLTLPSSEEYQLNRMVMNYFCRFCRPDKAPLRLSAHPGAVEVSVSLDLGRARAVHVEPMNSMLRAPGTKRLKLQYDEPPSKFAFRFTLGRYTSGAREPLQGWGWPTCRCRWSCGRRPTRG